MTIGEKLFLYRKQVGMSQEELAEKLNVTRQSISLWETDKTMPSLANMIVLAEIFHVGLDELCGTQATNDAEHALSTETEEPPTPEKTNCLVSAETHYTPDLLHNANKIATKKIFVFSIVALIISVLWGVGIIASDNDDIYVIIPIFFAVMFVAFIIRMKLLSKTRTAEFLRLYPNGIAKIKFFRDGLKVNTTSDNTDSKLNIGYSEIKKVINAEKYILIFYGSTIIPIEKNLPETDCDLILKLLNVPIDDKIAPDNQTCDNGVKVVSNTKRIKALLLAMFIVSLLSIFIALAIVAVCVEYSPIPEFPYTFPEYMWVLFIFLPIPLASAVLGIVFLIKKYKCKKNIIAGVVMCGLLAIFGSFPFIYKDYTLHDFGYVNELEQTVLIDLPDRGYISRAKNINSTVKSVAMIKFDDNQKMLDLVQTRFSRYYGSGLETYNGLTLTIPNGYAYYWICDTTELVPGVTYAGTGKHRCFAFAYNIEKNILFVVEFLYEP